MPSGVYKRTEQHNKNNKKAKLGSKNSRFGKHHTKETKEKMSEARLLRKNKLGYLNSYETRKKTSKKLKGVKKPPFSEEHKLNMSKAKSGKNHPMYGEHLSAKHKERISKKLKGRIFGYKWEKGEKHPFWNNGSSFAPYGLEFNDDLREVIRNRDRRKCQICKKTELENKEKLAVHHIDYCKQNNNPNNLISLCRKCHSKTNFNREYWINYLKLNI